MTLIQGLAYTLLPLATLALLTGCGNGSPFDYIKVSGRVTYEDGSPIPLKGGTQIFFTSEAPQANEKQYPRPAVATMKPDGTFGAVTSYKYGDGLVPGKHRVTVRAIGENGQELVSLEYAKPSTTPLVVDTKDAPFEMKVKKPEAKKKRSR